MEIFHGSSFSFKDIITGINFWFQRSLPNEAKNNLRFVKNYVLSVDEKTGGALFKSNLPFEPR